MNIELNMEFYARAALIPWLASCGRPRRPEFGFPTEWIDDRAAAVRSMFSSQWADAGTIAQGRLTAYLAKTDYDLYGATWNSLAKRSRSNLDVAVGTRLLAALRAGDWPASLADTLRGGPIPSAKASIGRQVAESPAAGKWEHSLLTKVVVAVNRAALELAYRQKFPKAPVFFETLLRVYEAGRLPCGWGGDLERWPEGRLLVY